MPCFPFRPMRAPPFQMSKCEKRNAATPVQPNQSQGNEFIHDAPNPSSNSCIPVPSPAPRRVPSTTSVARD